MHTIKCWSTAIADCKLKVENNKSRIPTLLGILITLCNYAWLLPVLIAMTGAPRNVLLKSPLLPTDTELPTL